MEACIIVLDLAALRRWTPHNIVSHRSAYTLSVFISDTKKRIHRWYSHFSNAPFSQMRTTTRRLPLTHQHPNPHLTPTYRPP